MCSIIITVDRLSTACSRDRQSEMRTNAYKLCNIGSKITLYVLLNVR